MRPPPPSHPLVLGFWVNLAPSLWGMGEGYGGHFLILIPLREKPT